MNVLSRLRRHQRYNECEVPSLEESLEGLIQSNKILSYSVLTLCMAVYLVMLYGIPLAIDGLYTGDMNEHLAWTYEFVEPGALGASPTIQYQRVTRFCPGIYALYSGGVPLFGVEHFAEILALLLGATTMALAFALGRVASGGSIAGGFVGAFLLPSLCRPWTLNLWAAIHGGLPRSFYVPIALAAVLFSWKKAHVALALTILASALFYPPLFPILSGMLAVAAVLKRQRPPLWPTVSVVMSAALLLVIQGAIGDQFGPALTWEEATHQILFSNVGLYPIATAPSRIDSMLAVDFGFALAPAVLILLSLVFARKSWDYLVTMVGVAIAGEASFIAAYLFFFRLYYPTTFTSMSLGLSAWLAAILLATSAIRRIHLPRSIVRVGAVLCVSLWLTSMVANTVRIVPRGNDAGHTGIYRSPISPRVCEAIHDLPAASLLAGPFDEAGDISFLCHRGVLVQLDDLFPYRPQYYSQALVRARAVALAMASSDWMDVVALKALGVTHVLVDRQRMVTTDDPFRRCYDFLRIQPTSPVVLQPHPRLTLFDDGRFILLSLQE